MDAFVLDAPHLKGTYVVLHRKFSARVLPAVVGIPEDLKARERLWRKTTTMARPWKARYEFNRWDAAPSAWADDRSKRAWFFRNLWRGKRWDGLLHPEQSWMLDRAHERGESILVANGPPMADLERFAARLHGFKEWRRWNDPRGPLKEDHVRIDLNFWSPHPISDLLRETFPGITLLSTIPTSNADSAPFPGYDPDFGVGRQTQVDVRLGNERMRDVDDLKGYLIDFCRTHHGDERRMLAFMTNHWREFCGGRTEETTVRRFTLIQGGLSARNNG